MRPGVGRGTVSRVINGSPKVSEQAREAVQQAIEELGYVPNRAARALVTRRTDTVALVVSESEERVFGEPYFAGTIRGISSALSETRPAAALAMAQSPAEHERLEHYLTGQHVDGVLLLSLHGDDPLPRLLEEPACRPCSAAARSALDAGQLRRRRQPRPAPGRRSSTCWARAAADRHHRRAAGHGRGRRPARRLPRRAAGRPAWPSWSPTATSAEESGAAAMRELLDRHPDLDAVFAASDPMALGAMRVLRRAGRRVPEDVAVIGFDDSTVARHTDPPLTTVHQPIEEMGRQMARLLLAASTARSHVAESSCPPSSSCVARPDGAVT